MGPEEGLGATLLTALLYCRDTQKLRRGVFWFTVFRGFSLHLVGIEIDTGLKGLVQYAHLPFRVAWDRPRVKYTKVSKVEISLGFLLY